MINLENENILNLVFENFIYSDTKQIFKKLYNRISCMTIYRKFTFDKVLSSLGKSQITLKGHNNWVNTLTFREKDYNIIITSAEDKTLKLWSLDGYQCLKTIEDRNCSRSITTPQEGFDIACLKNIFTMWDSDNNFNTIQTICLQHYESFRLLIRLSNGCFVCPCGPGGFIMDSCCILILDNEHFKSVKILTGHSQSITCLVNLPDNKFASGSRDMTIRIWNINDNYKCIRVINGLFDGILSLLYIKEKDLLLSASANKQIKVWRMSDYQCIKNLIHTGGVKSLLMLPDGYFASGSFYDEVIRIWDTRKFECVKVLQGHSDTVNSLLLLKDKRIASASRDGTIIIHNH
jgi:WD40 repeat protein